VTVASEFGGRIADVVVAEGQRVVEGQTVVSLDTAMLDAQIAVAEARVAVAEAGLAQARAGARPGERATARTLLAQAETGAVAAQRAVSDTQTLVDSPQQLDLEIAVARAQLEAAKARELEAIAQKDAIEVAKGAFDDAYAAFDGGGRYRFGVQGGSVVDLALDVLPQDLADLLPQDFGQNLPDTGQHVLTYRDYELHLDNGHYDLYVWKDVAFPLSAYHLTNTWWQSWVGVNAAGAQVSAVEAQLGQLYQQRANPQSLLASLDKAEALETQMGAQVALAGAQVQALEAGLPDAELEAIEARVGEARAALDALREQRQMYDLASPITGSVVDLVVRVGEVAAQGAPLLTIADLESLTLKVYVAEPALGLIQLGQNITATVDSFPNRVFGGTVSRISDEAEFTPRNVATKEERENLVFAVDIQLIDTSEALKPGMPADVTFELTDGVD
jgi:multidrug efflux pump subunit AcrA (membrane-fusion protein)